MKRPCASAAFAWCADFSGGRAVYHDMGNLNFTFITDVGESNALDLKLFCEPVVRTLATLGVRRRSTAANDITIDGKKFSGNSQYIRQGRVMHHGTIMFDSDLSVVSEALRVDPTKIQTKGIRSVRSRVTNVAEHLPEKVTLPEFRRILLENILKENPGEAYPLTQDDLAAVEKLRAERYATWDWNYGFSPACTMLRRSRVDGCGLIEAYITVEHGKIAALTFKGDFFSASNRTSWRRTLLAARRNRAGYEKALGDVDVSRYFAGLQKDELIDILWRGIMKRGAGAKSADSLFSRSNGRQSMSFSTHQQSQQLCKLRLHYDITACGALRQNAVAQRGERCAPPLEGISAARGAEKPA